MESSAQRNELAALRQKYEVAMLCCARCFAANDRDAEEIVRSCWQTMTAQRLRLCDMDAQAQSSYLMCSVYREAVAFYRSKRRAHGALRNPAKGASERAAFIISQEQAVAMLFLLPYRERQVATLKIVGYANDDVMRVLGIDTLRVQTYWMRAQQRMQGYLRALKGPNAF